MGKCFFIRATMNNSKVKQWQQNSNQSYFDCHNYSRGWIRKAVLDYSQAVA